MTDGQTASDEAQIRAAMTERAEAIFAKDADRVMALFTEDLVSFDVLDPLQVVGSTAARTRLQAWFAMYRSPIRCEIRDLTVASGGDVAFCHSLHRYSGTLTSGDPVDMWVRDTVGFRKVGGVWRITHEHMSDPFNPETGKASIDLAP